MDRENAPGHEASLADILRPASPVGLPDSIDRNKVLRLVREIGRPGGWTTGMIKHLRLLLSLTQAQDWEAGGRPVVWLSVNATAKRLGVSMSTVRNHERAMEALGAIKVAPGGNGRRCGRRGEDGTIVWAYGVELAPLGALLPRLEEQAAVARQQRALFEGLREEALALQAMIRTAIDNAVREGGFGDRGAAALRKRLALISEAHRRARPMSSVEAWVATLKRFKRLLGRVRTDSGRRGGG